MEDLIQSELDLAEEYILTKMFGNVCDIRLNAVPNWLFTQIAKGKRFEDFLNENIQKAEFICKGFMTENGYLQGDRISEFISDKVPMLKGCINLPTLKPIDYAKMLDEVINFEALGHIIRSL